MPPNAAPSEQGDDLVTSLTRIGSRRVSRGPVSSRVPLRTIESPKDTRPRWDTIADAETPFQNEGLSESLKLEARMILYDSRSLESDGAVFRAANDQAFDPLDGLEQRLRGDVTVLQAKLNPPLPAVKPVIELAAARFEFHRIERFIEMPRYERFIEMPRLERFVEIPRYERVIEVPRYERLIEVPRYERFVEAPPVEVEQPKKQSKWRTALEIAVVGLQIYSAVKSSGTVQSTPTASPGMCQNPAAVQANSNWNGAFQRGNYADAAASIRMPDGSYIPWWVPCSSLPGKSR